MEEAHFEVCRPWFGTHPVIPCPPIYFLVYLKMGASTLQRTQAVMLLDCPIQASLEKQDGSQLGTLFCVYSRIFSLFKNCSESRITSTVINQQLYMFVIVFVVSVLGFYQDDDDECYCQFPCEETKTLQQQNCWAQMCSFEVQRVEKLNVSAAISWWHPWLLAIRSEGLWLENCHVICVRELATVWSAVARRNQEGRVSGGGGN